jgi:hypothetical protein
MWWWKTHQCGDGKLTSAVVLDDDGSVWVMWCSSVYSSSFGDSPCSSALMKEGWRWSGTSYQRRGDEGGRQ